MSMMLRRRLLALAREVWVTVTGAVATFTTLRAAPLRSLIAEINNPVGISSVDITRTGRNLCGGEQFADELKTRISSATKDTANKTVSFAYNASNTSGVYFPKVPFKANTQYTFILTMKNDTVARTNLRLYYTDNTYTNLADLASAGTKQMLVVKSNASKTVLTLSARSQGGTTVLYYDESGVFEGNLSESDFEAYTGEKITVSVPTPPGTVYDGEVDIVSGVLTDNDSGNVYQLTPQQINALLGANNVWSDAGDVSVTYQSN